MRRLLLVPALALAVTAALTAPAGAGDQEHRPLVGGRVAVGGGVSVVLPAGWHLTRGKGTAVTVPIPRLAAATFAVRWSRRHCECDTPRATHLPRGAALLFVWEYPRIARRDYRAFGRRGAHLRISAGPVTQSGCGASDTVAFRIGHRGFEAEVYLGPDAPTSARAQIAAILDSWQVA